MLSDVLKSRKIANTTKRNAKKMNKGGKTFSSYEKVVDVEGEEMEEEINDDIFIVVVKK